MDCSLKFLLILLDDTLPQFKRLNTFCSSYFQIRPRVVLQPTNHSLTNSNSQVIRVVKSSGGNSQVLQITGANNSYIQNTAISQTGSKIISLTPKNVGSQSGLPNSFAGQKIYITTTSSTGRNSPLLTEVNSGKPLQILSQLGLTGSNVKVNTITSNKIKPTASNVVKNVSQTTVTTPSPQTTTVNKTQMANMTKPNQMNNVMNANLTNGAGIRPSVTSKDLSRIWSQEDIKLKNINSYTVSSLGFPISFFTLFILIFFFYVLV